MHSTRWWTWQGDAIDRVTHSTGWHTWQGDTLDRVMNSTAWSTWQDDSLDRATHSTGWCTWQGDALGKVMHLTKWHTWQRWHTWLSDPRDSGDAFDRKWQAWQEFLVFTDFTTFTVPEFRWLTDETVNYWQLTSVTTNLLIPYFTEAEFTCWLWLKSWLMDNLCLPKVHCLLLGRPHSPAPLPWPAPCFGSNKYSRLDREYWLKRESTTPTLSNQALLAWLESV